MAEGRPVSSLILAELYDSADASFLDLILQHRGSFKPLLGLIEKWKKDQRPWARQLRISFVLHDELPPDSRVVFKRLFKQAWADRDHELMGAFLVACDRMVRRKRAKHYRFLQGIIETNEVLRVPRQRGVPIFSRSTQHYLRRRAWRYFRKLAFKDGDAYLKALADALVRYRDDDVRRGENLLDNWGLMHACFGKSPVLKFNARHTNLSGSGGLGDLTAAPMFERHWATPLGMKTLFDILLGANCRPVRVWTIQLLRRLHEKALPQIDPVILLKLIDHADADVAAFAAELLSNAQAVASFPMTTWMALLATRNPTVVATIVEAFRKHVSFDRLTFAQAVELTTRAGVPVAALGLEILGSRTIQSDADLRSLAALAGAQAAAVAPQIAAFALSRLNVPKVYRLDEIVAFFDSGVKGLREGAFAALADQSPADTDPAFWARLFESPYDDVRFELVRRLKTRQELPGASADATAMLWRSVLLNIHRGGRAKLSALRQISDRVIREPKSANVLLPVLAVAIRSVRPPEARHGLAAVVMVAERAGDDRRNQASLSGVAARRGGGGRMIQSFVYSGHSCVVEQGGGRAIRLAPNLAREAVAFDAELLNPLRFREAISALHDVVISDLRFEKRDKTAYREWKSKQGERDAAIRRNALDAANKAIEARRNAPVTKELERDFDAARKHYWSLRVKYSEYLRKHDPELWRKLVPCDPVITVAQDVVFFECFSKDESAYGCLSVDRSRAFGASSNLQLGTTNVDYSEGLYDQFQTLRTYRPTRFNLDPEGFTVATQAASEHHEEKIDLPTSWLRGFMKLQAAMTMPTTRVVLTRESVYALLAFIKRHKARKSPRALRFVLEQGKPVQMILEPWEQRFDVIGPTYDGPPTAPIRIWGTRRLVALARLLPLIDSIEVHLLANGLPSFWVARMDELTFTLGLSGWTTNDWSSGSALDLLQPPRAPSPQLIDAVAAAMQRRRAASLAEIKADANEVDDFLVAAALRHLAQSGQVIFDIANQIFRYRQIMSQPLGEAQLGPEDPELAAARILIANKRYELTDRQDGPNMTRVIVGKVEAKPVEIMLDADDRIKRGKCLCGHYQKYGLRNGPCRHMIALRWGASVAGLVAQTQSGFLNRLFGRPT